MKYLWEDLKMLFEFIGTLIVIVIIGVGINLWLFSEIFRGLFVNIYTNDTNNTNEQIVDYDTYIQNTYNSNFNKNTQIVEKDNSDDYTITSEDLQEYKQKNDYIPGKANPFGN